MNATRWVKERIAPYKENILIKRLFAVLSIDILVKVSGMLLLPVYLRLMTQDEYGLYNYLIAIVLTFSLVLNFGLYIPLSKFYHDKSDKQDRGTMLFTISVLLTFFLSIILVPVYLFHWDYRIVRILFKNQIPYDNYRIGLLLAFIATVYNFMLTNYFYTSERIGRLQRYNIWRVISINVLTVGFLIWLKNRSDSVQVRLETTYVVEIVLFLVFSYSYIGETHARFSKKFAVSSLKLGLPVMINALNGIVINFSDKFFLEKYTSFKNLSYYFLAVSCASLIPLIFTSFQNAWLPLFLKEKDIRRNVQKTNKLMIRLFLGFIGLSLLIILFLKIVLVLGIIQTKYQEAIYILPIMVLSQIFGSLSLLYSNYLIYFEKTYIIPITGVIFCLSTIGLNLLLVPRFGVYGAATVSLASNFGFMAMYYFIVKHNVRKQLNDDTGSNHIVRI